MATWKSTIIALTIGLLVDVIILYEFLTVASIKLATASRQTQEVGASLTPEQWTRLYRCSSTVPPMAIKANDSLWTEILVSSERRPTRGISSREARHSSLGCVGPRHLVGRPSPTGWLETIWSRLLDECNREPEAWRYLYVDELLPGSFEPKVRERSSDERMANMIYSINLHGLSDLSYFKFNSGDEQQDKLNELHVSGQQVDDERCARDLDEMLAQMNEFSWQLERMREGNGTMSRGQFKALRDGGLDERFLRLARALDSYGRYESGMLVGSGRLMGDYYECIKTSLRRTRQNHLGSHGEGEREKEAYVENISMRFCWAKLSLEELVSDQLRLRPRLSHETADVELTMAVCLPRSCHSRGLARHKKTVQKLVDSQLVFPRSIYLKVAHRVESVFCLVDEDSPIASMPTSGRLCLVFIMLWTVTCVIITLWLRARDKQQRGPSCKSECGKSPPRDRAESDRTPLTIRIISSFDLQASWHDFTSDKRPLKLTDHVDLDVLNPIKLVSCIFCVGAHTALINSGFSARLADVIANIEQNVILQAALLASVVVDTFYVMSGLLVAYIASKKFARGYGFGNGQAMALGEQLTPMGESDQAAANATEPTPVECDLNNNRLEGEKDLINLGQTPGASNVQASSSVSSKMGLPSSSTESKTTTTTTQALLCFIANWFVLTASRYARLVPLYALMWWFRRDVLTYLGAGPMWDYGLNRDTTNGACLKEPWYTPFTPITAFLPLNKQCHVPSWSVSNDLIFGLIAPPFILMLQKRPRATLHAMLATICTCVAITLKYYLDAEPSARWELSDFRLHGIIQFFSGLSHLYTWPVLRLPGYLCGAMAGHALYVYERDRARRTNCCPGATIRGQRSVHGEIGPKGWPHWISGRATKLAFGYIAFHMTFSLLAMPIKSLTQPYHHLLAAFIFTLDRTLWSASNAILFMRMTTDWRHSMIMQSFASQRWRSLARLNYSILFIHWLFVVLQNGILTIMPVFSAWQLWSSFASILLLTLPSALIVHVVFENPTDKLIKRELFGL